MRERALVASARSSSGVRAGAGVVSGRREASAQLASEPLESRTSSPCQQWSEIGIVPSRASRRLGVDAVLLVAFYRKPVRLVDIHAHGVRPSVNRASMAA